MTKPGPLHRVDPLLSIREEWVDVHEKSAAKSPLLSFEFLKLWCECFADPGRVRVYRVRDEAVTIGFLPLLLRRERGIRVLQSLTNEHCFHSDPLVREGSEASFPSLLLKEIIRDRKDWDLFRHRFSYSFSGLPGLFPEDLLARCGLPWQRTRQVTYSVLLKRPFEAYFRGDLTTSTRKVLRKHRNRLEKEGEVRFRHHEGAEALRRWPDFVQIEGSGWKGRAGSSINRIGPQFQRFYQGLVELLAEKGALHLAFLDVDGRGVAGEFGYLAGDTFHTLKTGYDERFGRFSPGNLLLVHLIEDLSRNYLRVSRLHLFPWDHGYKHRYANETASCVETRLFSGTLRGRASHFLAGAKKGIRRVSSALRAPALPRG